MAQRLTREALYDLIWSKPKTALAKELGLSDVALGKACANGRVPVPPCGYWAARGAGKRVRPIPLPPRGLGESDTVEIARSVGWYYNEPVGELPPPPELPETLEAVIERAKKQVGKVSVRRSLARLHPLVSRLLEEDDERRTRAATNRFTLHPQRFDTPPAKRRLRLINALFLALSRAGCRPYSRGDEAEELGALVGHQYVSFSVMPAKRSRRNDRLFGPDDTKARLPLKITVAASCPCPVGLTTEWQDAEGVPLEDCLQNIVVQILVFGELQYRARTVGRYEWLAERKRAQDEEARTARARGAGTPGSFAPKGGRTARAADSAGAELAAGRRHSRFCIRRPEPCRGESPLRGTRALGRMGAVTGRRIGRYARLLGTPAGCRRRSDSKRIRHLDMKSPSGTVTIERDEPRHLSLIEPAMPQQPFSVVLRADTAHIRDGPVPCVSCSKPKDSWGIHHPASHSAARSVPSSAPSHSCARYPGRSGRSSSDRRRPFSSSQR